MKIHPRLFAIEFNTKSGMRVSTQEVLTNRIQEFCEITSDYSYFKAGRGCVQASRGYFEIDELDIYPTAAK